MQMRPLNTDNAADRETWASTMMLSPRETEKLVLYQVAEFARRGGAARPQAELPEAIALITEALLEAARDGKSVAAVIELCNQILIRDEVMEGCLEQRWHSLLE
jgi:urease subunit gamma